MPTFLYVTGIRGSAQDAAHLDWIEVEDVTWQTSQGEEPQILGIEVRKAFDETSGSFYQACAAGRVFPAIVVDFVKESFRYLRYNGTGATVSGVRPGPRDEDGGTEIVSFTCEDFQVSDTI